MLSKNIRKSPPEIWKQNRQYFMKTFSTLDRKKDFYLATSVVYFSVILNHLDADIFLFYYYTLLYFLTFMAEII